MYKGTMYDVQKIRERVKPYKDVIVFIITLLIANYFWKFTMVGDENGDAVTWFGIDITAPFEFMACHVADAVYWIVGLFRDTVYKVGDHVIRYDNGVGTSIIWGCTGLKQSFIFMCLILTVLPVRFRISDLGFRNSNFKFQIAKLWFIPIGWLCCYAFNIARIAAITLLIEFHPDWFHFLHDYLFKYLFYAMLFGLWVIFVEKIRPRVLSH